MARCFEESIEADCRRPVQFHMVSQSDWIDSQESGVDSVCFQFKPKLLSQVVQTRPPAYQKFSILERLDVKISISSSWRSIAENFIDDIGHGDDSFGATELIDHDGEGLRMSEEKFQQ